MAILERAIAHVLSGPAFAGYRIAAIADFHIAPWRTTRNIERAVATINAWQPDLVVLVGDYGHSIRGLWSLARRSYRVVMPRVARALASLSARDGVYAVLGNHDTDGGPETVAKALQGAGITVLRNEAIDIRRKDRVLRLVGVDDIPREKGDMTSLLGSQWTATDLILVASHYPDFIAECRSHTGAPPVVVLAGHTHGGQIAFPFIGAPITLSRVATRHFPSGFVPNDCATLYVTRGLGEQLPVRLLAPREVTLFQLAQR